MSGFNMPPGVSPGDIPGNRPEDDDVIERISDDALAEMRRYVGDANPHPQNVQAALADLHDAREARDHNHKVSVQLHEKLHKATVRVQELEIRLEGWETFVDRRYNALREAVLMADRGKSEISGVPPWVWERIVNIANGNEGGGVGVHVEKNGEPMTSDDPSALDCTTCEGRGAIRHEVERYVSHEMAIDAGEPSMEGQPIPDYYDEQCDHCEGTGKEPKE